jgi:hypothetical protein
MSCFTCSKGKDLSTVEALLMYKEASEKTGKIYWFFRHIDSNEIKIASNEDFSRFKKANKRLFTAGKFEFSRIDEFRIA